MAEQTEKPFAYGACVSDILSGLEFYVAQSLAGVVDAVREGSNPRGTTIQAWFHPSEKRAVPEDAYSRIFVDAPSRDVALAEVEKARINLENIVKTNNETGADTRPTSSTPDWYVLGVPLEEQIKAYIGRYEQETRVWLSKEEIEAKVKEKVWA